MHELKVAMLGPRGVGKTSLLTAMYERFASSIGGIDLQLIPDDESSAILGERLIELKSLPDNFEPKGGIKMTEDPRPFIFELGRKGKSPSLKLNFCDYPGEYLLSLEKKQFIKQLLVDSVAVLVAIDAPALMERKGRWNEMINRPQQVTEFFRKAYQELDSPRLVIFAPVRCEKYMQNERLSLDLVQRIKEDYKGLLDLFASEALLSNVAVVITPVQTLGSVIFSRVEMKNEEPHFLFHKIGHDARYSPKDSEQPLRYLLRFLLKIHLNNRSWGLFNFLRDIFGMDDHLINAVKSLSLGCKSSGGFTVLQGESLLNL